MTDVIEVIEPQAVVEVVQNPVVTIIEVVTAGPAGPTGPPGGQQAPYVQSTPLATWTIPNPFTAPNRPSVQVLDDSGNVIIPDIQITTAHIIVSFAVPTSGLALIT